MKPATWSLWFELRHLHDTLRAIELLLASMEGDPSNLVAVREITRASHAMIATTRARIELVSRVFSDDPSDPSLVAAPHNACPVPRGARIHSGGDVFVSAKSHRSHSTTSTR